MPILLIIGAVRPPHTTVVNITMDSVVDTYMSRCSPGIFKDCHGNMNRKEGKKVGRKERRKEGRKEGRKQGRKDGRKKVRKEVSNRVRKKKLMRERKEER